MRLMLTCGRSVVIALLIAYSWNAADAREAAQSEHAASAAAEQKSFDEFVARLGSRDNQTTDMTPEQVHALGLQQVIDADIAAARQP
jgi:uncharacterized protein (DUF885 family)